METQQSYSRSILNWISSPRTRAFGIAVVVLVLLAWIQVSQLKRDTPMSELFSGCQLQMEEIHRLQIAFGKAGLNEFVVRDQNVFVPVEKRPDYFKVASEEDAIPTSVVASDKHEPQASFLLSRNQTEQIKLEKSKRQVREMLLRLPFVERAWFNMDRAESASAFRPARQSAVVQIKTPNARVLSTRHVDTIRRMVSGAIAGLTSDDVVVINLEDGLALDEATFNSPDHDGQVQDLVMEQQRYYENQIRDVLQKYSGIDIHVDVHVSEEVSTESTAQMGHDVVTVQGSASFDRNVEQDSAALPQPGANGVVSLETEFEPVPAQSAQNVVTPTKRVFKTILDVEIGIPDLMVYAPQSAANEKKDNETVDEAATKKFRQIREDVQKRIASVLPSRSEFESNVKVSLIQSPIQEVAARGFLAQARELFATHWTSIAVVLIGLTLMTVVNRSGTQPEDETPQDAPAEIGIVRSGNAEVLEPEIRLGQMIEEDPEAAAKIIETWIRDAA